MTASTPTLVDARQHAVVVKAVLNAVLNAGSPQRFAYDYDEVPGSEHNSDEPARGEPLPDLFAAVSLERRSMESRRATGQTGRTSWRITVRGVGRTVDEARWVLWKVAQALNERRLTVGGVTTTAVRFESDQAPQPDENRFSGQSVWTYTH